MSKSKLRRFLTDAYYPGHDERQVIRERICSAGVIAGIFVFVVFVSLIPVSFLAIRPVRIHTDEEVRYALQYYRVFDAWIFGIAAAFVCLSSWTYFSKAGRRGKVVIGMVCTFMSTTLSWALWAQARTWNQWLAAYKDKAAEKLVVDVSAHSFSVENFAFWGSLLLAGVSIGLLTGALNNAKERSPGVTGAIRQTGDREQINHLCE